MSERGFRAVNPEGVLGEMMGRWAISSVPAAESQLWDAGEKRGTRDLLWSGVSGIAAALLPAPSDAATEAQRQSR